MKKILFIAFLLTFALSACTNNKIVSLASSPTPPPANASASEGAEVHDPPTLLEFPKPDGFVNDFADALSEKEEQDLETVLQNLQARAKVGFAIVVVNNPGERTMLDYTLGIAKEWKVGGEKGAVLFLIAVEDKKWQLEIDQKLEEHLTQDDVRDIGMVIVPDFRNKKYAVGIRKCVDKMIAELAQKQGFETLM